jgi:alpha-glucoside transport system substrate-binding protein
MTARSRSRGVALVGTAVTASLLIASCSSSSTGSGTNSSASSNPACAAYSAYMGHSGTTVTMFASILSPESDSLQKSWAEFSSCTGIKISYQGSNNFESQLPVQVAGGNAPDLAIIPQPGLLAKMVSTGKVAKPPQAVTDNVTNNWNPAWKTYGSVNGTFYAAPMSSNAKSLVWYSPKEFAAAGYTVPTTWSDLMALSAKIATAGKNGKPWCGGIASGTATGWPATDWLEEVMLRMYGPDVYAQWITNALKFNDPKVKAAMDTVAGWMKNPAWVNGGYGGVQSIATTTFQDAGLPILKSQCWMLQQASFYEAQWPAGTTVSPTGAVYAFYLPSMGQFGNPVEGGGEFVTAFSSRPEVQAVQTYLSTAAWATSRIKVAPGWVSANDKVDPTTYTDPIDKLSYAMLTDPKATFVFDASDAMPSAVGSGAEWTQFTAWFAENKDTQAVLDATQAAWPAG